MVLRLALYSPKCVEETLPPASLSIVWLSEVDLGPLLAAFGVVLSIIAPLSLPDMRPLGSARQVVVRK